MKLFGSRHSRQPSPFAMGESVGSHPSADQAPSKLNKFSSKLAHFPKRMLRAAVAPNAQKLEPSAELASTAPNALPYERFTHSQHPSSGPVAPQQGSRNLLSPPTEMKTGVALQRPVVNNKNEVESQQAAEFCRNLMDELGRAEEIVRTSDVGSKKYQLTQISEIQRRLLTCSNLHDVKTDNVHQFLRDQFAEIAMLSKRIVKSLPGATSVTNESRNGVPEGELNQLVHFFDDFREIANEVKRHHYDRASVLRIEAYAEQEYRNLLILVSALALQRKGSELITSKELIVTALAGIDQNHLASLGGSLTYTYTRLKRMFVDLDGDAVATKLTSHSIGTGFVAKLGSLLGVHGKNGKTATFQAIFKGTFSTGDYIDYKTWREYFKAEAIHDSQKRLHLRRSGDANSFGTRAKKAGYSALNYVTCDLLGVTHARVSVVPYINQKKRCKGINNADKIGAAAARLQTRLPGAPLSSGNAGLAAIVQKAYPVISDTLNETGLGITETTGRFASSEYELDEKAYSTVSDQVSQTSPAGLKTRGQLGLGSVQRWDVNLNLDASFDLMQGLEAASPHIRLSAKLSSDLNFTRQTIDFLRLKPTHELLDPAYNQDIEVSHNLLHKLHHAKGLHYAPQLRGDIGISLNDPSPDLDNDRINNPTILKEKFDYQWDAIVSLRKKYIELSKISGAVKSFSDKNYQAANKDAFEKFKAERKLFIAEVFGIDSGDADLSPEQKKFLGKLEKDPEFFMIRAYDVMSTRLGQIGADIYKTKEWSYQNKDKNIFEEKTDPDGTKTDISAQKRRTVDLMYQSLRNIMDGVFLPLSKETLLRGGAVRAAATSESHIYTAAFQAKAGADFNPVKGIPAEVVNPTSLIREDKAADWHNGDTREWMDGGFVGVGGKCSYARTEALEHPNPIRQGTYDHFRISGTADGMTALAFTWLSKQAVKVHANFSSTANNEKFRAAVGLEATDAANAERMNHNVHTAAHREEGFVEDAIMLAKRTALSENTGEWEGFLGKKAPPSVGEFHYKSEEQYFRVYSRNTQRVGGTISAPLIASGVPVTPAVGAHRTCTDGNVLFESLGKSLSYQVLSFNELQNVIDKAAKPHMAAKKKGPMKVDATKLDEQCDFDQLQKLFLGHEDPNTESVDGEFKLHKFFGNSDSILGFVEDFDKYADNRRQINGEPVVRQVDGKDVLRSEFDYFDDHPEYWKTIMGMTKAKEYAPGTELYANCQTQDKAKAFLRDKRDDSTDPRPKPFTESEKKMLRKVKNHFDGEGKNMTSKQRMEYFLTNPDGKFIFQSYCDIVVKSDRINEALKARNKYECSVVID